jgi:hypothetical protein
MGALERSREEEKITLPSPPALVAAFQQLFLDRRLEGGKRDRICTDSQFFPPYKAISCPVLGI